MFIKTILAFFLTATFLFHAPVYADSKYRGVTVSPGISPEDIADLAPWGANVVRYTMTWHGPADTATREEYMDWLQNDAMVHLDALLPKFQEAKLKVILNLYSPPGGFVTKTSPPWHRIFAEQWAQDALKEAWTVIAQHYNGNPAIIAYDLVNEPAQRKVNKGLKNWRDLSAEVAAIVRAIDSSHMIIIETIYGNQEYFKSLKPIPVSNVGFSFHYYYPRPFQAQGLNGSSAKVHYPTKKYTKKVLLSRMERAIKFQKKYKVPIYVGEFSAVRWAPANSTYNYLKDLISIFQSKGWHWTYHSYRENDAWSVEHTTNRDNHDRSPVPTNRMQLLWKYFARNTL